MCDSNIRQQDMHRIGFICEGCDSVSACMKLGCRPMAFEAAPEPEDETLIGPEQIQATCQAVLTGALIAIAALVAVWFLAANAAVLWPLF
jgi:hypothetical protein